jgi:methyl-accepting chemotaxis protein
VNRSNPPGRTFPPRRALRTGQAPEVRTPARRGESSVRRPAPARPRGTLLLDLPIAWRLGLGFLLAALVAAVAVGASSLQRTQALSSQSAFYQSLLSTNTSLTTGDSFLQLMNTKLHDTLTDASAAAPSKETLAADQTAVDGLAARFDAVLVDYQQSDLISLHPERMAIVTEAGRSIQVTQQRTLAQSAVRTWQVYKSAQDKVLQDVATGDLASAQALTRAQAEPTNADAQSALRALIQFDGRLASTIHVASDFEQRAQLVTALVAAALAFLAVGGIGWVISNTLVRRLRQLRRVSLSVEQGELQTRVAIAGRDEIASVSQAVNGMLDMIVGLVDVTRRQRDALTSAAERLFSDVRVAGAGDLRVQAAVSGDPIGMLANAFNFTVGRFRRFVLRTQTTVDQLDVVTRQQYEYAQAFHARLTNFARESSGAPASTARPPQAGAMRLPSSDATVALTGQIGDLRDLVRQVAQEGAGAHARNVLDFAEQAYLSAGRVSQLALSMLQQQQSAATSGASTGVLVDELRTLGTLLTRLAAEAQAVRAGSGTLLAEVDSGLVRLTSAVPSWTAQAAGAGPAALPQSAGSPSSAQVADFIRLADGFARDIATLARQISAITQEMRTGLVPFRLSPQDYADTPLYAPGTGYEEPPGYGSFGDQLDRPRSQPSYPPTYPPEYGPGGADRRPPSQWG